MLLRIAGVYLEHVTGDGVPTLVRPLPGPVVRVRLALWRALGQACAGAEPGGAADWHSGVEEWKFQ